MKVALSTPSKSRIGYYWNDNRKVATSTILKRDIEGSQTAIYTKPQV